MKREALSQGRLRNAPAAALSLAFVFRGENGIVWLWFKDPPLAMPAGSAAHPGVLEWTGIHTPSGILPSRPSVNHRKMGGLGEKKVRDLCLVRC